MTQAIRTTAPEPLAAVPFSIARPFETSLDNGLRIVFVEEKRLPLVNFRLAFLSGDIHDPEGSTGLTSAMASMLNEGTENYSSRELAEKIERLGASLSANSSDDFTIIAASGLSVYRSELIEMLSEVLFRPTFPESELDLYKRNTIENLKFQRSQPNFLAGEQTSRILYGKHPYSVVSPTAADIEKLTRERLIEHRERALVPNNAILIAVGDVDRDELMAEIKDTFGGWPRGEVFASEFPEPPGRDKTTLTLVDRPGSAQSNIVISGLAIDRGSPDYFPFLVMNQVLGAGASSRVFMNLREEKGYTYGAYTRLDSKRLAGDLQATAEVRTPVTGESLKEFFYELNRIRDERVPDEELADAKNFLTGVFPIRAETQDGLTSLIVSQQLYGLPDDYLETYRDNVDAVTSEEVQRVANQYIHPDKMAIVIVGDAGQVLPQAEEYASDVEIFDTNGSPKSLEDYAADADEPPADIGGSWELTLDFQGQMVPVELVIEQQDGSVSGTIKTAFGGGTIDAGTVRGSKLSATAVTEIQGQQVDLVIVGRVDGEEMSGTLSAAVMPGALNFSGRRK